MKKTKIVVPIMPTSFPAAKSLKSDPYEGADIIEWRADYMEPVEIIESAPFIFDRFKDFELLFTYRTQGEGGKGELTGSDYADLLAFASDFKPTYIDVEFAQKKALKRLAKLRDKIVLSYHNFEETPEDLFEKLMLMQAAETAFVKCATQINSPEELLFLFKSAHRLTKKFGPKFIFVGMGKEGRLSRVATELSGSIWTFASLPDEASAPGQFTLLETQKILDILEK